MSTPTYAVDNETELDLSATDLSPLEDPELDQSILQIHDDRNIDGIILPPTLHTLIIGRMFYHGLNHVKFPQSLKRLVIESDYDLILQGAQLPDQLVQLIFNGHVSLNLNGVQLPKSLRVLKLGAPIPRGSLPRARPQIQVQEYILQYNTIRLDADIQYIYDDFIRMDVPNDDDDVLVIDTSNITHLTIGFKQRIRNIASMNLLNVVELTLGSSFDQTIAGAVFRDISVIHDYSRSININSCAFPHTIYRIVQYIRDDNNEYIPRTVHERNTGQFTKCALRRAIAPVDF
jgi:hypothetical protein